MYSMYIETFMYSVHIRLLFNIIYYFLCIQNIFQKNEDCSNSLVTKSYDQNQLPDFGGSGGELGGSAGPQ